MSAQPPHSPPEDRLRAMEEHLAAIREDMAAIRRQLGPDPAPDFAHDPEAATVARQLAEVRQRVDFISKRFDTYFDNALAAIQLTHGPFATLDRLLLRAACIVALIASLKYLLSL